MKIPQLKKEKTVKKYHGVTLEDNYAWIQQENILDVLKDPTKLNPEVKKYLEENNEYTERQLKNTKKLPNMLKNDEKLEYWLSEYFQKELTS